MKLSPAGRQLVSGQPRAWASLLRRPVRKVHARRPGYRGSSSRLRRLDVLLEDGSQIRVVCKQTNLCEARFYGSLAARIPLDVPHAYYVEKNAQEPQSGTGSLCILEAVPPGRPVTAWSASDERLVLADLARLHAAFWCSAQLDTFPWLQRLEDDVQAQLDKAVRGLALLRQIGGWPGVLSLDTLNVMEALLADRERLLAPLAHLPPTLLHCDAWQPNWAISDDRRVLLDWQSVAAGPALWDVVYFLEISGEANGRLPLQETEAMGHYLDALERERAETASFRTTFLAALPAVSVINILSRWTAYALDYLRPIERWPLLGLWWTRLPLGMQARIAAWAAWTDAEYYGRTFTQFNERARAAYGV